MTNEIKEILYWFYDEYPKEEKILEKYITNLQEEKERLKKQYAKEEKKLFHDNEILQQRIDKAFIKAELIKDIGFDYDGYNDIKNLKKVIDELVSLADNIQIILRGDE